MSETEDTNEHNHEDDALDPHAWQDVAKARLYAHNIANALALAIPSEAQHIRARAAAYDQELAELDAWIRKSIAAIPEADRKIVTSHDAFGYFGQAYGVTFLAPQGVSTETEPTATDVAELIAQIKTLGIHTLFIENMTNPRLITQIAKDTGATLGAPLYADALSIPSGPAPTYITMMRNNVTLMLAAMKKKE